jgi:hypothetical protein
MTSHARPTHVTAPPSCHSSEMYRGSWSEGQQTSFSALDSYEADDVHFPSRQEEAREKLKSHTTKAAKSAGGSGKGLNPLAIVVLLAAIAVGLYYTKQMG